MPVLKRSKVKEWSEPGVGDLRGGPVWVSFSMKLAGGPAPFKDLGSGSVNMGLRPGLCLVALMFSPSTFTHRSFESCQDVNYWMSLSVSDCASSGLSPFTECYRQEHIYFSNFKGTENLSQFHEQCLPKRFFPVANPGKMHSYCEYARNQLPNAGLHSEIKD